MGTILDDDGIERERRDAPSGLFLSRRGAWYHDGDRVKHQGLEGLLHRSIARDATGNLLVTTGRDTVPFVAEDAPFVVRTIAGAGAGDGVLVLSDGTEEPAAARPFYIDDAGHIRCVVKHGTFWAVLSRSATQAVALARDLTPCEPRDWSGMPA